MISSTEVKKQAGRLKIGEALSSSRRGRFMGKTADDYIRYFFFLNASGSILVLILIMVFLFKEGSGFVPMYRDSLQLYRKTGMEFADIIRDQVTRHRDFARDFNQLRLSGINYYLSQGMDRKAAQEKTAYIDDYKLTFTDLISGDEALAERLKKQVLKARDAEVNNGNLREAIHLYRSQGDEETTRELEGMLEEVNYQALGDLCHQAIPEYDSLNRRLATEIPQVISQPLELPTAEMDQQFNQIKAGIYEYVADLPGYIQKAEKWNQDKKIMLIHGLTEFLTGTRWLTASYWQDFYGIIPLFVGSLMISSLALAIAVPLSIAAAVYVNQMATDVELQIIKPYIEFVGAIPSVVLGFFGIAVLGSALRNLSGVEWLQWFPGFPMSERLTIATAGILLALMAIPTIFTLVEDALNNVPRYYTEASYALGANRLQTIIKIMIPTALSGIVAAVLLGLGRVIGETMVVLLCAGGMIAIPDFSAGLGAWLQPAHTMTGIIAQELGEVEIGSIHYRALFMLGLVLFFISLFLNVCSQYVIKRFRISE